MVTLLILLLVIYCLFSQTVKCYLTVTSSHTFYSTYFNTYFSQIFTPMHSNMCCFFIHKIISNEKILIKSYRSRRKLQVSLSVSKFIKNYDFLKVD
jgi:hypothetical protein